MVDDMPDVQPAPSPQRERKRREHSAATGSVAAGSVDESFGVELRVDDRLIAQDSVGFWCAAKVLAVATAESGSRPAALQVHFIGFKSKFDEWISIGTGRLRVDPAAAADQKPDRKPAQKRRRADAPAPPVGQPLVASLGGEQPTPPAPPEAAADVLPTPRHQRERKRKQIYGDNGENDGAASSFCSAPPARKASISLADENGVPGWAFPDLKVWAKGWHAGQNAWFKARVVKVRKQFPRIHVAFEEDEHGNSHAHALPELDAYVHAADVRARDW